MTVHILVEVTANEGSLEELEAATRTFLDDVQANEEHARSAQAFTLKGSRSILVHLGFDDELAAHDHRHTAHTTRFTERIQPLTEAVDIHELEPLGPVSPQAE